MYISNNKSHKARRSFTALPCAGIHFPGYTFAFAILSPACRLFGHGQHFQLLSVPQFATLHGRHRPAGQILSAADSELRRSASPGARCSGGGSHKFSCPLSLPSAERVYFVWRSGNAIPPKNHPFCSWVSYSWATDLTEEISTRWWCTTIVPVERNKFTWLKINY